MTHDEEDRAIAVLVERLIDQHSNREPEEIITTVNDQRARLTGPVRDFVPLLVERFASEQLRAISPLASMGHRP